MAGPAMTLSFLLLGIAVLIFRYLAFEANAAFRNRLMRLLRRKAQRTQLFAVLREHPGQLSEFRRRVLPYAALQVGLDALACVLFVGGLYLFPPQIGMTDLLLLQRGSVLVVGVALMAEILWLGMALRVSLARSAEIEN